MSADYIPPDRKRYLTLDAPPEGRFCRVVSLPDDPKWIGLFDGLFSSLTVPWAWRKDGTLDEEEMARVWFEIYLDQQDSPQCAFDDIAPYWDDEDGADAPGEGDFPWYENLADFVVTAFLAVSFTPAAAIEFVGTARKFRLAFRSRDYGAVVRVLLNDVLQANVDTYSATPGLVYADITVPPTLLLAEDDPPWTLRLEHTGTHNENAVPVPGQGYAMEVIRKRLYAEEVDDVPTIFRQDPENACRLEQSIDSGETWTLAFDYSLCITPTQQIIYDAAIDTIVDQPPPPGTPGDSWIYDPGDTSEDVGFRVSALCYASRLAVDAALDAYIAAKEGELTPITLAAVILGLVAVVVGLIVSAGSAIPLYIALAEGILWVYTAFTTLVTTEMASDQDTRDAMYCVLYQHLLGRPVTEEAFRSAFDDYDCGTSDEEQVAALLKAVLNAPQGAQIYAAFLGTLGGVTTAVRAGAEVDECGCDNLTWCKIWIGDEIPNEWQILSGTFADNVVYLGAPPGGGNYLVHIAARGTMYIPAGSTITSIGFNYVRSPGANQSYSVNDGNGSSQSGLNPSEGGFYGFGAGSGYSKEDVPLTPQFAISTNGELVNGYLHFILMSGTGRSPYGVCQDC